jgi:hypothetical protein
MVIMDSLKDTCVFSFKTTLADEHEYLMRKS